MLEYKKVISKLNREDLEFVVFPTSVYLGFFYDVPYKIGSQSVSLYESGSVTGEVLASQLKSLKVSYVLLNHFEAKEVVENVILKVKNATKQEIKVVLCVGEETRQTMDETVAEIMRKVHRIYTRLSPKEIENIVLAYEPGWAINKQDIVNTSIINSIAKSLKKEVSDRYHFVPDVVYGGGITMKNIKSLTEVDNIDGYLLGNCANVPENISKIFTIV